MALTNDIVAQVIINNQPNGNIIEHSKSPASDPESVPFNELSRRQQCDQIALMLDCGVEILDLQTELYLVSDLPTDEVWEAFGVQMIVDCE